MKMKFVQQIGAASLSLMLLLAGCSTNGNRAASPQTSAGPAGSPVEAPTDVSPSAGTDASPLPSGSWTTVSPSTGVPLTPSVAPTDKPSVKPTVKPTVEATAKPTLKPTVKPSTKPTAKPTTKPTTKPSTKPTVKPTGKPDSDAVTVIAKPEALDVLVNKQRLLPADYVPADLVEPKVRFPYTEKLEKRKLRKEAAAALTEMFEAAEQEGIILYAVSGYRSYQTQKSLYASYVKRDGEEAAARYSAKPGTSEHQTGLTMDVSSKSNNFQLTQAFGETKEGKWLAKHSWEYGFIIRYQQETESITGYMYEPWHVRYIGKPTAKDVFEQSVTLEEYYNLAVPVAG